MAVPPQWLNQIEFSDQHSEVHVKTFKSPVIECRYSRMSIFGVFFSATRFDDTVLGLSSTKTEGWLTRVFQ